MSFVIVRHSLKHPEDRGMMAGCAIALVFLLLIGVGIYACLHKPETKIYQLVEGSNAFTVIIGDKTSPEVWMLSYKDCDSLSGKLPDPALGDTLVVLYKGQRYEWEGCMKNQPLQFSVSNSLPMTKPTPTKSS